MADGTVLGVPIDSVGRSGGTELAPAALREAGLVERLGIADRGDVDVRIRGEERDPETGIVGSPDVLRMTVTMRSAIRSMLSSGQRPLVLGGCCSLVPGAMAGVRDATGSVGIANVDGHVDVYDGVSSPTGPLGRLRPRPRGLGGGGRGRLGHACRGRRPRRARP